MGSNHNTGDACNHHESAQDHVNPGCAQHSYPDVALFEPDIDGDDPDPIAICGFSIKFPQEATSPEALWEMLLKKNCAMSDFPPNRINPEGFYSKQNRPNTIPLRGGHFIKEELSAFDAEFFSIAPAEAAAMDPMQRWLLETAYRALENAGIPMESVSGSSTAVYTGSFSMDYMIQLYRDPELSAQYAALGLGLSMLANRLSWFFNFQGPSVGLDTACSSTATAIDLACQALRSGDCGMSLVAGCNLTFSPEYYTWMTNLNFLSPDSRCYSFDHRSNGYARGEGIAVMVLKRLSAAIRDGNTVRAVIRATGCNEDGRTLGITQPSSQAQQRLIRETYAKAGLSLEHTRFFEAHGTGTPLGDPLEAEAIGSVFRKYRSNSDPIYVGAVKSNIGHLEGPSGLAGVIKAVLVLEKGIIPPNANFEKLNTKIDAEYLKLKFPEESQPWPTSGLRRASVNSFGYGGANAHIVLDDAYNYMRMRKLAGRHCTEPQANGVPALNSHVDRSVYTELPVIAKEFQPPRLLVISAADENGISRVAKGYEDYVSKKMLHAQEESQLLENLAYTLDTHRTHHSWRSFALASTITDLCDLETRMSSPVRAWSRTPRIGFVFTGQGAQWFAMGRELMYYESFQQELASADIYLATLGCRWSVTGELMKSKETSNIDNTDISQALCTVLQVAIVNLLRTFNIKPSSVVGHSSGEIAAAYAGNYISARDAWKLAYLRGICADELSRNSISLPKGSMMAIGLPEDDVKALVSRVNEDALSFGVSIACVNSPSSITVAGEEQLLDRMRTELDEKGVFTRKLRVKLAYHSAQMENISAKYVSLIGSLSGVNDLEKIPMISSVTGKLIVGSRLVDPSYWALNMVSTVQFSSAITNMCLADETRLVKKIDMSHKFQSVVDCLLEIGPHAALQGPIRDILRASPRGNSITYSSILRRGESAMTTTLKAVGELYSIGIPVMLRAVNEASNPAGSLRSQSMLTDLPGYPFDHSQHYWHESRLSKNYRFRQNPPSELLGVRTRDWNPSEPRWRHYINTTEMPWTEDHIINGTVLYPAAGMIVMAIEAAKQLAGNGKIVDAYMIRDLQIDAPINLTAGNGTVEVQTTLYELRGAGQTSPTHKFIIRSCTKELDWLVNCTGFISLEFQAPLDEWTKDKIKVQQQDMISSFTNLLLQGGEQVSSQHVYQTLRQSGLEYGQDFQLAQHQRYDEDNMQTTATVTLPKSMIGAHVIHPTTLDAIMHLSFTILTSGGKRPVATSVPTRLGCLWVSNRGLSWPSQNEVSAFARLAGRSKNKVLSSGVVLDASNSQQVRLWYDDLELTQVTEAPASALSLPNPRQFCMNIDCKVALNKLDNKGIYALLEELHSDAEESLDYFQGLELLVEVSIQRLIDSFDFTTLDKQEPWKQKYIEWASFHLARSRSKRQLGKFDSRIEEIHQSFEETCDRFKQINHTSRLWATVASNLVELLDGSTTALELLTEDGILKNYYQEIGSYKCSWQIASYIDLLAHQSPGMRILELGGGTGEGTRILINSLLARPNDPEGILRCSRYEFTDISAGFFDAARAEFRTHSSQMTYGTLDIERDFADQGFPESQYDVVLAVSVLHVSTDLSKTLQRVRKALKPGGKLIFQEPLDPNGWTFGFVFGLFPGWWLGENDNRRLSPAVDISTWNALLIENGFSGVELSLEFGKNVAYHGGWIISSAVDATPIPTKMQPGQHITIIIDETCALQVSLAEALVSYLKNSSGMTLSVMSFEAAKTGGHKPVADGLIINLVDYGQSFLGSLSDDKWQCLQALINESSKLLWVSSSGGHDAMPDHGLLDGLARTLRFERYELHLVTLALETYDSSASKVPHIVKIVQEMVNRAAHQNYEQEYIEIGGLLHTRRLVEARYLKSAVNERLTLHHSVQKRLNGNDNVKVSLKAGDGITPHYVEPPSATEILPEDSVDVKVRSVALQPRDRSSIVESSREPSFGRYCSGFVSVASPSTRFQIGDRVFAVGTDLFRSKVRLSSQALVKIPPELSFADACWKIPPIAMAYYALVELGRVQAGNSVLIHGSISPTGQASIELLARRSVTEIWVTATGEDESKWIADTLKLPQERILPTLWFDGHPASPRQRRQKFDIIFSTESSSTSAFFVSHLRPGGRYIMRDGGQSPSTHAELMCAASTDTTVSIIDSNRIQPTQVSLRFAAANAILSEIRMSDHQMAQFPAPALTNIFDKIQNANEQDTVIVNFKDDDVFDVTVAAPPEYMLDPNASYLISGGLGGLGREIARWLVSRGARYLILLSRSGPRTNVASSLIAELGERGAYVETPRCDVSDRALLRSILASCSGRMPPIKGCIQASMVMTESMFEQMQFSDWKAVLDPKVKGSWNLHTECPKGLDFFVLISSLMGIFGTGSLAGYNAGNTYQDALARYRISQGERAVSIDLGGVADAGFVAESAHYSTIFQRQNKLEPLLLPEVFSLLDIYCSPDTPLTYNTHLCQSIVGIKQPTHWKRGEDEPFLIGQPFWGHMRQMASLEGECETEATDDTSGMMNDQQNFDKARKLAVAGMISEAADLVSQALARWIKVVLGTSTQHIDSEKPLQSYGIDSLSSITLRNWISKVFGVDMAVFEFMTGATIASIGISIARKIQLKG